MEHIAVVGFKNLREFRDWAERESVVFNDNGAVATTKDDKRTYYCIMCENDINGRIFDYMIDCDRLRQSIQSRIRGRHGA